MSKAKHRKVTRVSSLSAAVLAAVAVVPGVAHAAPTVGHAPGLTAPVPAPVQQAVPSVSRAAQPLIRQAAAPAAPATIVVENKIVQETSPGLLLLNPQAAAKLDAETITRVFGDNIRDADIPVIQEAATKSAATGVALGLPVAGLTAIGGGTVGAVTGGAVGAATGAAAGAAVGAAGGSTLGGVILGLAGTTVATPVGGILVPEIPVIPGVAAGTVAAGIGAIGGGVVGGVVGGAVGAPIGAATGAAVGGTAGAATGAVVGGAGAAALGTSVGVASTPRAAEVAQRVVGDVVWDLESITRERNGFDRLVGEKPGGAPAGAPAAGTQAPAVTDAAVEHVNAVDTAVQQVRSQVDQAGRDFEAATGVHVPSLGELGL